MAWMGERSSQVSMPIILPVSSSWLADKCNSGVLLLLSIDNTVKGPGPKSAHAAGREEAHWRANHGAQEDPEAAMSEKDKSIQEPEAAHTAAAQADSTTDSMPYTAAPAVESDVPR